jgi:hypothetical protein
MTKAQAEAVYEILVLRCQRLQILSSYGVMHLLVFGPTAPANQ